jgi:hypothetical protein
MGAGQQIHASNIRQNVVRYTVATLQCSCYVSVLKVVKNLHEPETVWDRFLVHDGPSKILPPMEDARNSHVPFKFLFHLTNYYYLLWYNKYK